MPSLKMIFAEISGFFVLLPACMLNAWTPPTYPSIKPVAMGGHPRPVVDVWKWQWLNYWYANPEDGVSGQQAWIFGPNGTPIPYTQSFPAGTPKWVIAYCWSAWRNGANNLTRPTENPDLSTPWKP